MVAGSLPHQSADADVLGSTPHMLNRSAAASVVPDFPVVQPRKPDAWSLRQLIRRDWARYHVPDERLSVLGKIRLFLDNPGMQAVFLYRYGHRVRRIRWWLVRYPLALVHYVLQKLCIVCWGISIDAGADIGPGLYVAHFGGIIIGPVRMGQDCNIAHHVTIGMRADVPSGVPSFGDNVWIGTGALIYGDVSVGSGVMIGPYTVVSRSVPDRTMVLGNPMRVMSSNYDNHFAIYGYSRDDARARDTSS